MRSARDFARPKAGVSRVSGRRKGEPSCDAASRIYPDARRAAAHTPRTRSRDRGRRRRSSDGRVRCALRAERADRREHHDLPGLDRARTRRRPTSRRSPCPTPTPGCISFRDQHPEPSAVSRGHAAFVIFVDSRHEPADWRPGPSSAPTTSSQLIQGEIVALSRGTAPTSRAGRRSARDLALVRVSGRRSTVTDHAARAREHERLQLLRHRRRRGSLSIPTTGASTARTASGDFAPAASAGLYPYEVKITPPTLVVRSLKPTPGTRSPGARSRSASSQRAPIRTRSCRTAGSRASGGSATHGSGRRCSACRAGRRPARGTSRRARRARPSVAPWQSSFEGLRATQGYSGKVR